MKERVPNGTLQGVLRIPGNITLVTNIFSLCENVSGVQCNYLVKLAGT